MSPTIASMVRRPRWGAALWLWCVSVVLGMLLGTGTGCDSRLEVLLYEPRDAGQDASSQTNQAASRDAGAVAAADAGPDASADAAQVPSGTCDCGDHEVCAGRACVALPQTSTIAAGDRHTCRVYQGQLFCWGDNSSGQVLPDGPDLVPSPARFGTRSFWVTVAAGARHTCALRAPGVLRCWGDDSQGQLGMSQPMRSRDQQRVPWEDFTQLQCGGDNCCALREAGALYCWGSNVEGKAGIDNADVAVVDTPTQVAGDDLVFIAFSVGSAHTCAIANDNTLWCWGSNASKQLGLRDLDRASAPTQVGVEADWLWIAAGGEQTCGIRRGNLLYCWGDNTDNQVGIGRVGPDGELVVTDVPSSVSTTTGWVRVAAGGRHACSIKTSQDLFCWGRGDDGQLGTMVAATLDVPTLVLEGMMWRELALGAAHSCGLDANDPQRMFCWGSNDRGQLGLGDTDSRATPGEVVF